MTGEVDNLMLNDRHWRFNEVDGNSAPIVNHLRLCECEKRPAVLELNGQRLCKPCAIESGEVGADDLD